MGGKRKKAREDAAEKALELACGWLHRRKMALDEKVTADGLNAGMSLWSPGGKTEFENEDFPAWDWNGSPVPRDEAWLRAAKWLFSADDWTGPKTVEIQVTRALAPGWIQTTTETASEMSRIPKFSFSSLEEFILKAETSGDFREG